MALRPRHVAIAQGAFYVATGLWPIVSMRTFELASGPKREKWLVKTMGALIAAVGAALVVAPSRALGVLAASALGASDVWYAGKGRIARTYLLDAVAEAGLVAAWAAATLGRKARPRTRVRIGETPEIMAGPPVAPT